MFKRNRPRDACDRGNLFYRGVKQINDLANQCLTNGGDLFSSLLPTEETAARTRGSIPQTLNQLRRELKRRSRRDVCADERTIQDADARNTFEIDLVNEKPESSSEEAVRRYVTERGTRVNRRLQRIRGTIARHPRSLSLEYVVKKRRYQFARREYMREVGSRGGSGFKRVAASQRSHLEDGEKGP